MKCPENFLWLHWNYSQHQGKAARYLPVENWKNYIKRQWWSIKILIPVYEIVKLNILEIKFATASILWLISINISPGTKNIFLFLSKFCPRWSPASQALHSILLANMTGKQGGTGDREIRPKTEKSRSRRQRQRRRQRQCRFSAFVRNRGKILVSNSGSVRIYEENFLKTPALLEITEKNFGFVGLLEDLFLHFEDIKL